ncbi:unnamed protein product (macronuclear) [Paramecium tetraurelia]|uniref:Uncharacterized protein n=1 Tax=Paramecium tetraurelia TaxID=5888 RepID=A0DV05_PARTE|nr:uncharacterized protein GSPATT00020534001 [Paramecium tetraurelia]CAK86872.1 unnamed protein product [Paramecium tetraurelia]|eukprot:XP_001454269.1 hypothetical protein (macronuclear) [Paramecium tetraurelia strain d4-2]
MFFSPQFQEFMENEKSIYSTLQKHLDIILANQLDFTYHSVFQLFCHISILHNTQASVFQALMKMIGSLVEQNKQTTISEVLLLDNQPKSTKFLQPNFLEIFEDKQTQASKIQKPLNASEENKKISIQTEIDLPKEKVFRETVKNRKERQQINAHECEECEQFYKALPNSNQAEKLKQDFSRHRINHKLNQEKLLLTPE